MPVWCVHLVQPFENQIVLAGDLNSYSAQRKDKITRAGVENKTIKKNTGAETNHSKLIYRKEVKLYTVDKNKVHVARRDGLEISREVVI